MRRKVELEYVCSCLSCMHIDMDTLSKQYYGPPPAIYVPYQPAPDYPITLPARGFKSEEVMNLPRVSLQETEVIQYQHYPQLLQRETFVYFDEDDEKYQIFRIPAFIPTANPEITFYLEYADEGPEAVAWADFHLFEILRTSKRILN
jgi:hypothetical protein